MTRTAPTPNIWQIGFVLDSQELALAFAEALEDICVSSGAHQVVEHGAWRVEAMHMGPPDRAEVTARLATLAMALQVDAPDAVIEPMPDLDWLSHVYQGFPPIHAGRFYIHGSHHDDPPPHGTLPIHVDAATAFGSGEHESTFGCLTALSQVVGKRLHHPRRVLDMGCGTAILGMAAARLYRVPCVAVDMDAESVRVARYNARRNGLGNLLRCEVSMGYQNPIIRQRAPYDLIFANIFARPLVSLAPALRSHLAPGGYCILAGLLARQANMVEHAHRQQGLKRIARLRFGEWITLVLQRP
ncbi:MAG: 50S ribosomal protein L11 methyltransferase [Alphaproteobacteria bacterium]